MGSCATTIQQELSNMNSISNDTVKSHKSYRQKSNNVNNSIFKHVENRPMFDQEKTPLFRLLIEGYLKSLSNCYTVPIDILQICDQFYDESQNGTLFINLRNYTYPNHEQLIMSTMNNYGLLCNVKIKIYNQGLAKPSPVPRSLCYLKNFNLNDLSFQRQCNEFNIRNPSALLSNSCIIFDRINTENLKPGLSNMIETTAFRYDLPFEYEETIDTIIYSELHETIFVYSPGFKFSQRLFKVSCNPDTTWLHEEFLHKNSPCPVKLYHSNTKMTIAMNMIDHDHKIWISGTIKPGGNTSTNLPLYGGFVYDLMSRDADTRWTITKTNNLVMMSNDLYYHKFKQCMYGCYGNWKSGEMTVYQYSNLMKYDMIKDEWIKVNHSSDAFFGSDFTVWGDDNHRDLIYIAIGDNGTIRCIDERDPNQREFVGDVARNNLFLTETANWMDKARIYFSP